MAVFTFTALDGKGKTIRGKLDVSNKGEAYRRLEQRALTPIHVRVPVDSEALQQAEGRGIRLSRAQIILFSEELSDLLDAGLQLQQALNIMHERQQNPAVRRVSKAIREHLRDGATFAASLRMASPSFDDLYCNLVAAGEVSGSLTQILKRLASSLTILHELQARVVQALIYPAFMILACIGLITVFMTVLVPQLTDLLKATNQELPGPTKALINISQAFQLHWWKMLLGAVGAFILFQGLVLLPTGRLWWDRIKVKIPLVGPVLSTRYFASFSQALGNLVANGVPLLNGIKLMIRATTNRFYRLSLQRVAAAVEAGDAFSTALRHVRAFPPLLVDLTAIGEQTGDLGRSLAKAAKRYDKELNGRISRLTSLITPVIIIIMAVIVTIVAYSIVTAIFKSVNGIRATG